MKYVFRVLALCIMVVVIFWTYDQASGPLAWWGEQFPVVSFAATTLLMFVGIIVGSLFQNLSAAGATVNIVAELKAVFSATSFWLSVCVAPFVLFSVYATVSAAPGDAASYLLAFQNGFFCQSVFKKLMPAM